MTARDRTLPPPPDLEPDINTGTPWTEMAVEDLQAAWRTGADLAELSAYLCRDWREITAKCKELNLDLVYQPQRRRNHLARKKEGPPA